MQAREILNRGIQTTEYKDTSYSYTGLADFKQEKPEVLTLGPKRGNDKPRPRASKNNSYT